MGQIHNELRKGWLTDGVNRALGRTREGGVERVTETLDVVMNPWGMPEWAIYRGELLKGQRQFSAAVAGENSVVALVNAAGRNRIVTVEVCGVAATGGATACSLELCTDAVLSAALAVANAGPVIGRDTRGAIGTVFTRTGSEVATSLGTSIDFCGSPATETKYFLNLPVVLSPGFGLAIIGQTVNLNISGIFGWRERAAYPGELV